MQDAGQDSDDVRRLAELSALADGTLDADRRPDVEARIAASGELRRRFEREQRVVAALAAAREQDRAPARLRARIQAARPETRRRPWTPAAARAGAVAALAVIGLALALVLPSGTPGSPSVSQAAAFGARSPVLPAPPIDRASPAQLTAAVGQLHFPNWSRPFGWRALGERRDRLTGRDVVTVYYEVAGQRVAYSIVSGSVLPRPAGATNRPAAYVQAFRQNGRNVVTWRQSGHTCVLSAAGLSAHVLTALVAHA